jgi:TatD DNase family protein
MVAGLIDVHAHLQDEAFFQDLDGVLGRIEEERFAAVINAGTDLANSRAAVHLAETKPWLWALAGFHPHEAKLWNDDSLAGLEKLLDHPRVLGVGEIGLDYHYHHSEPETQKRVFLLQWELACRRQLPAIIHIRSAFDDFFALINDRPHPPKVLLHCFSGNLDIARRALDLGFHFSIGGPLTFHKNEDGRAVFRLLPEDRIHLETDCPYLAPEPFRGKRCEPAHLTHSFRKLCQIRKADETAMVRRLADNARAFFGPRLVCPGSPSIV